MLALCWSRHGHDNAFWYFVFPFNDKMDRGMQTTFDSQAACWIPFMGTPRYGCQVWPWVNQVSVGSAGQVAELRCMNPQQPPLPYRQSAIWNVTPQAAITAEGGCEVTIMQLWQHTAHAHHTHPPLPRLLGSSASVCMCVSDCADPHFFLWFLACGQIQEVGAAYFRAPRK